MLALHATRPVLAGDLLGRGGLLSEDPTKEEEVLPPESTHCGTCIWHLFSPRVLRVVLPGACKGQKTTSDLL
jgi:hypothetical protein